MYAIKDGSRVQANPNEKAVCPLCSGDVTSKCGSIKVWHWAHLADLDCDDFKESESEWHRRWKEKFPEECREVLIKKWGNLHYADVKTGNTVIEFQNSSISYEKIREREKFYWDMAWVFNCQDSVDRIKRSGYSIEWFAPKRNFTYCKKPVYLDFGKELFLVKSVAKDREGDIPIYTISGKFIEVSEFISEALGKGTPTIIRQRAETSYDDSLDRKFRCKHCKKEFTGKTSNGFIYRIADICAGSDDDLEFI